MIVPVECWQNPSFEGCKFCMLKKKKKNYPRRLFEIRLFSSDFFQVKVQVPGWISDYTFK